MNYFMLFLINNLTKMKKIKILKKLELSKESISLLSKIHKGSIMGGEPVCSEDNPRTCDKVVLISKPGGENNCTGA
jgi:hypothetical protein